MTKSSAPPPKTGAETDTSGGQHLRVLLTHRGQPVKMLLDRELPEGGTTIVQVRPAEDDEPPSPYDISELDFDLPGIGRVERRRRDQTEELRIERPAAKDEPLFDEEMLARLPEGDELFLTKPLLTEQVGALIAAARAADSLDEPGGKPVLGDSEAMREILSIVERVAAGSASVLIHGETGTGKTMLARRIHDLSPRRDQRFVAINCSAFQESLLETELFGHEKGAFTGAAGAKQGLFEIADGGTLFLDEIGDMSSAMQAKLLQVLDDGELRRVGGTGVHRVDTRIIAASNKDLQSEVKAGRFREDLLFRLKVIFLRMPRLAERQSDIPLLIEHLLHRYRLPGEPRKQISPEAIQLLRSYSWPGNIRELANTIEGVVLLATGPEIRAEDLPQAIRPHTDLRLDSAETPLPMREVERLHIQRTLRYTEGKKAPAARLLQIDVKTLKNKIKLYEIEI